MGFKLEIGSVCGVVFWPLKIRSVQCKVVLGSLECQGLWFVGISEK